MAARPPIVSAVDPGTARPRWSVMIPTYNCAELLRDALTGVLAQDPGRAEMQIEVIDDCSPDDRPEDVVAELAGDRVTFWRHPHNLGIASNFTSCLARARGHLVHVLHGDDVVYDGLYATVNRLISERPEVDAIIVGAEDVDQHGAVVQANIPLRPARQVLDDFEQGIFSWNPVRAPAVVARREVYERIGGFHPDLRYCADWDMWKRMTASSRLLYEPEVFVGYRVHSGSDTARLGHSVSQLQEMIHAVRIAHDYLPDGRTRGWTQDFYGTTRRWAFEMLRQPGHALSPAERGGYLRIVAESTLRLQTDRLLHRTLAART